MSDIDTVSALGVRGGAVHGGVWCPRVRRIRRVREAVAKYEDTYIADGPVRGANLADAALRPTAVSRRPVFRRCRLASVPLVVLALVANFLFGPRAAYAEPVSGLTLTAEFLSSAFAAVGTAVTGVTLPGLGAVGAIAGVGGYAWWASENPEAAEEFEQWLASDVVASNVSNNVASGLSADMGTLPASVKESIIDGIVEYSIEQNSIPIVPDNYTNVYAGRIAYTGTYNGMQPIITSNSLFVSNETNYSVQLVANWNNDVYLNGTVFFSSNDFVINNFTQRYVVITANSDISYTYIFHGNSRDTAQTGTVASGENVTVPIIGWAGNGVPVSYDAYYVYGINLGSGYKTVSVINGVSTGLSTAFDALTAGTGTASEVITAGNVSEVMFPGVTIDTATGTPTVTAVSDLTYADVAVTSGGSVSPDVPIPSDVLTGIQSILSLLTQTLNVVTTIPPFLSTTLESGVIVDIPTTLNDILGVVDGIPQSLDDLLDGLTIDIPASLADLQGAIVDIPAGIADLPVIGGIASGVQGLQGTLSSVLNGVLALPASIAGALDLDWALEGLEDLRSRLPSAPALLVLPQATWTDFQNASNDFKDMTPLGPIVDFVGEIVDVTKGNGGPYGAPRYEMRFPRPDGGFWLFVVDFGMIPSEMYLIAHAVAYAVFGFWYVRWLEQLAGLYKKFVPVLDRFVWGNILGE